MRRVRFFVALALALFAVPAHAFRTAADLPDFVGQEHVRWAQPALRFDISGWLPPGLSGSAVAEAVRRGFSTWTAPQCTSLAFGDTGFRDSAAVPGDGIITIQWIGQGWTDRGFGHAIPATTELLYDVGPSGLWEIVDADIYLNGEQLTWSVSPILDEHDIQAVITHEVGHAIGLLHNCNIDREMGAPVCQPDLAGAVMYPEYQGPSQRTLSADDEEGLCFLYPDADCFGKTCPTGTACTFEGCAVTCDRVVCQVGERCSPRGCTSEPCAPGSCERGCEATCTSPGGADADPCAMHLECYSGHCSMGGYCTATCGDGQGCPTGDTCDHAGALAECVPTADVFGAACSMADDCKTGLCLAEASATPMCTRTCGPGTRTCPDGHTCSAVGDLKVCMPEDESSGCQVGQQRPAGSLWVLVSFAGALVLGTRRRALALEMKGIHRDG